MNYDAVFIVLALLAITAPLSLVVARSFEVGAELFAISLVRTVLAATGAVLVVCTVPLLSDSVPQGEYGGPVGSFLGALVVLAIGFACERHIATGGAARTETGQKPVVQ